MPIPTISGLRRDALASLVLQGLAIVLTLASGIVLARALGPAEYGAWATCLAAGAMLSTLAALGFPNLLTRRVAEHQFRREWPAARAVVGRTVWIGTACALAVAGTAALIGQKLLFVLAIAAVPFMTLTNLWGAVLRGLGYGVVSQALPTVLRPLILLAGVCVVFLVGLPVSAALAMEINLAAAVVTLVATVMLYRWLQPHELESGSSRSDVPGLWQEAMPFLLVSVVAIAGARLDLFLITALIDTHAAGLYEVAYRGAELVMLPLTATTAVLGPEYARRHALADRSSLQRLVTQSCRGLLFLGAPIALGLMLFPTQIVQFVFGAEYAAGASSMTILAAGYLITLAMGPVHVISGMTGHSRASASGALLALGIGATVSLALIPSLGIEGAAISRVAGQLIAAAWLAWLLWRRTGIRTVALVRLTPA